MQEVEAAPGQGHAQAQAHAHGPKPGLVKLALGAVGVVYGDIGTSPLYTIKECFQPSHHIDPSRAHVLGILSLIFWALVWVVVFKYLSFILRADNRGEGGILALLSLVLRHAVPAHPTRRLLILVFVGLLGASLLYGEGVITPAISVLSAVEGLSIATHVFTPYVLPITVAILVGLFLVQKRGTGRVGAIFGPITLIWFVTIGAIGVPWILERPEVLEAMWPVHGIRFLVERGPKGFLILGSVVLAITGCEALYADMGHFGRAPIRLAWYVIVFPGLLLNYFGQGALLLARGSDPHVLASPFYGLVTGWQLYPLIGIATVATVIASQALISGAFSLTHAGVQLGYFPRVSVVHTSGQAEGQIYIPEVNYGLMVFCLALVLAFRSSTSLAAAYGIAVTTTMTCTSILFSAFARRRWGTVPAAILLVAFLFGDLLFLATNIPKIEHGGWFPLVLGSVMFVLMTTWKRGREALGQYVRSVTLPLAPFLAHIEAQQPPRVPGTAIFMTSNPEGVPLALSHHFRHNKLLHEKVVLLSVQSEHVPTVPRRERVEVKELGQGFFHVIARYGFMQTPRVGDILRACNKEGVHIDPDETSYFLGRETLLSTGKSGMSRWRKSLFAFLSRNARPATAFFHIPPDRVVEMGTQIQL